MRYIFLPILILLIIFPSESYGNNKTPIYIDNANGIYITQSNTIKDNNGFGWLFAICNNKNETNIIYKTIDPDNDLSFDMYSKKQTYYIPYFSNKDYYRYKKDARGTFINKESTIYIKTVKNNIIGAFFYNKNLNNSDDLILTNSFIGKKVSNEFYLVDEDNKKIIGICKND